MGIDTLVDPALVRVSLWCLATESASRFAFTCQSLDDLVHDGGHACNLAGIVVKPDTLHYPSTSQRRESPRPPGHADSCADAHVGGVRAVALPGTCQPISSLAVTDHRRLAHITNRLDQRSITRLVTAHRTLHRSGQAFIFQCPPFRGHAHLCRAGVWRTPVTSRSQQVLVHAHQPGQHGSSTATGTR